MHLERGIDWAVVLGLYRYSLNSFWGELDPHESGTRPPFRVARFSLLSESAADFQTAVFGSPKSSFLANSGHKTR